MFKVPEQFRIKNGSHGSNSTYGNNGAFIIPFKPSKALIKMFVIASDYEGWEHVSVSVKGAKRCPSWEAMCFIKDLFWDDEDAVIQFHPPKSEYVNTHAYTLHLWRPIGQAFPLPDSILVGVKGLELI